MGAYVRPLAWWYVVGTFLVVLTNGLSVRVPVEMAHGLDALRAGAPGVRDAAIHIGLLGVAIIATRTLSRVLFFTPGRHAEFALREDLFAHLLRLQPDFYAKYTTGDLLSRATSDVTFARAFAGFALLQGINVVAALFMAVGQMLLISPTLTLACAVPVAVSFVVVRGGVGRMFDMQRQAQAQLAALSDDLLGSLQGVATVQAFCVEETFVARLLRHASALRASNLAMARLRALVFPVLTVAGGVCVFLLISLGGDMVLAGRLTAGQIAAFIALVAYLLVPLRLLGVLLPVFQRSEASLERIYTVLDAVPDRPDAGRALPLPVGATGPTIELRHLSYAWPDAPERKVLDDVDVVLPGGATIGVFGRTGAGKSTLLRLLARLDNPPPGTVFVDGVDVTRVDLPDWRHRITMVPQAPFLFSESIEENVGLGASGEAIRTAVAAASLSVDLKALPDGLGTVVGERGISLSGGQRQRVALARGLVRDTDVVLLDDVLSAVDHHTERELLAMLRERRADGRTPTRIIVSHRLSALEQADMVLVLDEGRLVDQGTHAELLARPGPYRDAWSAQREAS
ncbi:MAG: ABC transporter ATP-binding protein [Pseudomonadota bacterium]|nr:ABC transporter ATP-binding protein [Pseudomonadota bacterium]